MYATTTRRTLIQNHRRCRVTERYHAPGYLVHRPLLLTNCHKSQKQPHRQPAQQLTEAAQVRTRRRLFPRRSRTAKDAPTSASTSLFFSTNCCCPRHDTLDATAIVKGYEYAPGQFLVLDDNERERLRPARDRALTLDNFIASDQIDPLLYAERALDSLGLAELQAELQPLTAQKQEWERRQRQAQRAMLALVRRVPVETVRDMPDDAVQVEIRQAIDRRQALHEEELLAVDEGGQHILRLRREREQLQDTVRLARSSTALRQRWANVVYLLGEEPTVLQRRVLAQAEEGADASDA